MSSSHSHRHYGTFAAMLLAAFAVLCMVTFAAAQEQPAPKWELYGGYSFFHPGADIHGVLPLGLLPVNNRLEPNPRGVGASVTYDFNRWFGLTLDSSTSWNSGEVGTDRVDDTALSNLSLGPKFTFRHHRFSPFLEVLVGDHRLMPDAFHDIQKVGVMAGGGLDINLTRHVALRLLRADFVYSNYRYGPSDTTSETEIRGVRLQSGLVFMLGGEAAAPVGASCSVQPGEVMAGEPVSATATASNFNPRHTLDYRWTSTGGRVSGNDANATVDTNGLAGGSYTVTARVSDPKRHKIGEAICSSTFIAREPAKNPPTISCLANPATLQAGMTSTIDCTCTSPDNASFTVGQWTASSGSISGSGNTAALDTSGASPGAITVGATCSDSRGLNTPATAMVMVENPPPISPEVRRLEGRLALHSIYFPTAKPTAEHPDGGLLASQQQTLVSLADDFQKYLELKPDAHLILKSHADHRGSVEYNQALSERRVDRTRQFLVEHGVPAASLETKALGEEQNLTEAQVKDAVEQNPELTPAERQRVLDHMRTIVLASNRRVDVTLSTTGQESVREYPFNAADSLTLIKTEETKRAPSAAKRKARPKAH
jgi:outer membrane protein OmpA-like peptidoglycan-associated protein/opacity protein-like surface antigen